MPPTSRACWLTRLTIGLLACFLCACNAREADSAFHAIEASHKVELGGDWEPPAQPPEHVQGGSDWIRVSLPHARPRSVAEKSESLQLRPDVAWYRLEVPAGSAGSGELFLYMPRWQTIGVVAIYADGRLVHRTRGSRVWNSFNRPILLPLADPSGNLPHTVLVRMASQRGVGGAVSTLWVGREASLLWRYRIRTFLQSDLVSHSSAAFVIIGLFSLAVWSVRRREHLYALFFIASVAHLARSLHYVTGDRAPLLPDDWFGWMTVNSVGWVMVCIFAFAFRVHHRRMPLVAGVTTGLVGVGTLVTLPAPFFVPHLHAILPLVYMISGVLITVIAVSGLWASYRANSREGLVFFVWYSLTLPVGVHDLLLQSYRIDIEGVYLAPYTSMGMFFIFLMIVYRRYIGAITGVEAVNASLETRLSARERELTASHEKLRELERQQTLTAERQRLMQDMHDGIGSSLMTALRMVEKGNASTTDTALVLKDCIDDLKLAIDSLETTDADLLALLAAVRFRLAPRLKAAGIDLTWSVRDLPPLQWLDPQSALHVLRILQEVLTNILKHSGATAIDVATSFERDTAIVRIRDNGEAFVPGRIQASGQSGKGLSNIRTRAQALGGRCEWVPWLGGSEFSLALPLRRV